MSITIAPLAGAVSRLGGKAAVGSDRTSQQWRDEMPLAMRERAFFSARLQSAHMAQGLLDLVRKGADLGTAATSRGDLTMSRSLFVREGRKMLDAAGYRPTDPAWEGTLLDHRTRQRLGLIYDTNLSQAREYARWQAGQDEGALDAFPAQELYREEDREKPRDWQRRWAAAGGPATDGRMIALKSDPVWSRISAFGTPFPPYDFGSGMGVRDIDREESESLGLIAPGETPERADVGFNDELQASVKGLDPAVVDALVRSFGDQAIVVDGSVKWRANLIGDLFDRATRPGLNPNRKGKQEVSIGLATKKTADLAREAGADLEGVEMFLREDDIAKNWNKHGPEGERRSDQRPLTKSDFRLLPELWRNPDSVVPGNKPRTLEFRKEWQGTQLGVVWQQFPDQAKVYLRSFYAKKNAEGES